MALGETRCFCGKHSDVVSEVAQPQSDRDSGTEKSDGRQGLSMRTCSTDPRGDPRCSPPLRDPDTGISGVAIWPLCN